MQAVQIQEPLWQRRQRTAFFWKARQQTETNSDYHTEVLRTLQGREEVERKGGGLLSEGSHLES